MITIEFETKDELNNAIKHPISSQHVGKFYKNEIDYYYIYKEDGQIFAYRIPKAVHEQLLETEKAEVDGKGPARGNDLATIKALKLQEFNQDEIINFIKELRL